MPYCGYETYDFNVPVAKNGDIYDRYLVRMAEMRESVSIARQAWQRLSDMVRSIPDQQPQSSAPAQN
jgi:NADH-quinone oxidoreductase subunit D